MPEVTARNNHQNICCLPPLQLDHYREIAEVTVGTNSERVLYFKLAPSFSKFIFLILLLFIEQA